MIASFPEIPCDRGGRYVPGWGDWTVLSVAPTKSCFETRVLISRWCRERRTDRTWFIISYYCKGQSSRVMTFLNLLNVAFSISWVVGLYLVLLLSKWQVFTVCILYSVWFSGVMCMNIFVGLAVSFFADLEQRVQTLQKAGIYLKKVCKSWS